MFKNSEIRLVNLDLTGLVDLGFPDRAENILWKIFIIKSILNK